jgi:Uma2 family endonuclease
LVEKFPPVVRAPDIVVAPTEALDARPNRLAISDVRLVIEIVSPGSARTDRVTKMAGYAEAGIPSYWIVDIEGPVRLDTYQLAGDAYRPVVSRATGTVTLDTPAPVTVDLAALLP